MITKEKFEFVKEKYGLHASWAVWGEQGERPKDNMGDLTIFDDLKTLNVLNPNIVLVGLNFSVSGAVNRPFENFHGKGGGAYKIRFALHKTKLWGAYMTDIIKSHVELEAFKVMGYLNKNPAYLEKNIKSFKQELKDIGSINPILVAFGIDTHKILNRYFRDDFSIVKLTHYSNYQSKENYRKEVLEKIKVMEF